MSLIKQISGGGSDARSIKWVGEWTTAYNYRKNDQVEHNNDLFTCSISHTSGSSTEPGIGASWTTRWIRNIDVLSTVEKSNLTDHVADTTIHTEIDDAGVLATKAWSAYKANSAIAAAEAGVYSYEAAVLDILNTPPAEPTTGDRYIVGVGTGDWLGENNNIAEYGVSSWTIIDATAGMATYVDDVSLLYLYNGTTWNPVQNYSLADTEPVPVDYDTGAVGIGIKVARDDHTHDLATHSHDHNEIDLDVFGEITYNLEDFMHTQSAGRISGGTITEYGDEEGVTVSEWRGLLKTSEADVTHIKYVIIPETTILVGDMSDNTLNYIIADYNSGDPRIISTTNRAGISTNTQSTLGRVYVENGDLEIYTGGMNLYNQARINHDRLVARGFERMSGADVYEIGERYLGLTAGVYYFGMNKINVAAINTSTTGAYTRYIRDPGSPNGWSRVEGLKQSTNLHYDDGSGTPAELPDGTHAVRWVYVCLDGDMYLLDGQNYFTLAEAKVAQQPSNRPDYIVKNAKLAAKLIIEKGADHFEMVVSGYESALFGTIGPSNHEGLAGLSGGASNDHYHLTATEHTALTIDLSDTITGVTDPLYSATDHDHDSTYSALTHDHNSTYSVLAHAHASAYAALAHTHTESDISDLGDYALSDHNHDSDYSDIIHNHNSDYAALSHNHTGVYATASHNHDLSYAALSHAHASTSLSDYSAPTTWNPTLVWVANTAPASVTVSARYTQTGKLVTFWLSISGADGDAATFTSATLPVTPANTGLVSPVTAMRLIDTARTDPFAYVDTAQAVAGNRLLKLYSSSAFTNSRAFALNVSGQYEAA
jgi:hypothetical protein